MGRLHRLIWICALVALLCGPASADRERGADQDREHAAVAALLQPQPDGSPAGPDEAALRALLATPDMDAWRLVEHLLALDRKDLALRLAQLTEPATIGPLAEYAASPEASAGLAERARVLGAVYAAADAGDLPAALAQIERLCALPSCHGVFRVDADSLRGGFLLEQGHTTQAAEAFLAGGERALGMSWWGAAAWLFRQALEITFASASLELAVRAAEGARAVASARGDGAFVAEAEQNLASIAQARSDLPGALLHLVEAESRYEALGRPDDVADVRRERLHVLAEMGDFRAALELQRAQATYFEGRPRNGAWAANQVVVGLLRFRLGDAEGASAALTEALDVCRSIQDASGESVAQGNLGLVNSAQGRWSDALGAYRAALHLQEREGDALLAAVAKNNVADALRGSALADLRSAPSLPDPDERAALAQRAQAALAEARTLVESTLPEVRASGAAGLACQLQLTLGDILLAQGRAPEALAQLEPGRDEATRLQSWSMQVSATVGVARARLMLRDWPGALREARDAATELGRAFSGLADADLARARAQAPDVYDIGVSAAREAKSMEDLAYFLEAGRAAALLRGLGGRAVALRATVPQALMDELAVRTRAKVAAFDAWQVAQRAKSPTARELWSAYEAAQAEEQRALERTQEVQSQAANRLAPARLAAIRDVQARLRATTRPKQRQVFAAFNFQEEEALALLIEPTTSRVVTLPAESLAPLREALATLSAARKGELDRDALAVVRRLLIDPLGIPAGPTRLYVCPDRDLAYAPLSAVVPDDWEVVWEPSATTFDLLSSRGLRRGQAVLGLGDPDYKTAANPDALATRGGPRLYRLEASKAEVEAITSRPGDVRLLQGRATERRLREELAAVGAEHAWRSVHLACHGLVDVEIPALSRLAITAGDGEDGFLYMSEVLQLALRADLAVLSACQTGRGLFVRGEGVMSLTRAFMFAGAQRVIVSLWDVDDAATAFLMETFYRLWSAGMETSQALREAQLAVRDHAVEESIEEPGQPARKQLRHPWKDERYWAAWTLWGLGS